MVTTTAYHRCIQSEAAANWMLGTDSLRRGVLGGRPDPPEKGVFWPQIDPPRDPQKRAIFGPFLGGVPGGAPGGPPGGEKVHIFEGI